MKSALQASSLIDRGLAEKAYDLIRSRLLRGEFPLGSSIPRRDLAAELGISLQPIADALQRLEYDGLVENINRVGSRARIPRPQELRGLLIVREALERRAAGLFSQRASIQQRQELEQMARQVDADYEECADSGHTAEQLQAVGQRYIEFHVTIAHWSGCPMLRQALERNLVLIVNYFWVQLAEIWDQIFGRVRFPPHFHADLAAALAATRDEEEAERVMREHLRYRSEETMECLEAYYLLDHSLVRGQAAAAHAASAQSGFAANAAGKPVSQAPSQRPRVKK
jgi:DNA-binding GntR family transcriptional regulator